MYPNDTKFNRDDLDKKLLALWRLANIYEFKGNIEKANRVREYYWQRFREYRTRYIGVK